MGRTEYNLVQEQFFPSTEPRCVLIFRQGLLSDRITVSRYGLFFQDDGNRQQTARRLRTVTRPAFRPFRKYDNMTHEVVKCWKESHTGPYVCRFRRFRSRSLRKSFVMYYECFYFSMISSLFFTKESYQDTDQLLRECKNE